MTAEKPNLVDGLRAAIAEATPEQHRKVDEYPSGFIAEKLPVPSDEELWLTARSETIVSTEHARLTYTSELRETWLAGYHARCGRTAGVRVTCDRATTAQPAMGRACLPMTSTKPSDKRYTDSSGNECSLDTMCRREPEWAANRMRWMIDRIAELEAEVAELRVDRDEWYEQHERLLAMYQDEVVKAAATPRRTPELTERVARAIASLRGYEYWQDTARFDGEANELLDLVFGKEQE